MRVTIGAAACEAVWAASKREKHVPFWQPYLVKLGATAPQLSLQAQAAVGIKYAQLSESADNGWNDTDVSTRPTTCALSRLNPTHVQPGASLMLSAPLPTAKPKNESPGCRGRRL